jgi:hypothetical protein
LLIRRSASQLWILTKEQLLTVNPAVLTNFISSKEEMEVEKRSAEKITQRQQSSREADQLERLVAE